VIQKRFINPGIQNNKKNEGKPSSMTQSHRHAETIVLYYMVRDGEDLTALIGVISLQ
jgi:hypothetical protein